MKVDFADVKGYHGPSTLASPTAINFATGDLEDIGGRPSYPLVKAHGD